MVQSMAGRNFLTSAAISIIVLAATHLCAAEPSGKAVASFNTYVDTVERRLSFQHRQPDSFLASEDQDRLLRGELIIEKLAPESPDGFPGAMLHDWRGTVFVGGATAADFERLMRDFTAYPKVYAPQVTQCRIVSQQPDRYQVVMRVRQKHVITVVMDTAYDVSFGQLDRKHGYSNSRSTRISEIADAGTSKQQALRDQDSHGFLWRLNTYWSYEERDGGLYMQIESVSLTRSIPAGLGWVIKPFVESVPRDSLEFTLRSTTDALRKH